MDDDDNDDDDDDNADNDEEVDRKDGQISELLAEISGMKEKLKEMGADMYQCNKVIL